MDYITVQAPPEGTPVDARFSASPVEAELGNAAIQFEDESTGDITSWSWNFGDGTTSTEQKPSHTYEKAGKFNVSLTVSGPGGTDTETKTECINITDTETKEGICLSKSPAIGISVTELTLGWGIIGLCWGTGYFLVRGIGKRKQ